MDMSQPSSQRCRIVEFRCRQYNYMLACLLLQSLIFLPYGKTTTSTAFSCTTIAQPSTRNNRSSDCCTRRDQLRLQRRADPLTVISTPIPPRDTSQFFTTADDDNRSNARLDDFVSSLTNLMTIRPPIPSADFSVPSTIISAGSSYTRLWRATTWEGHQCPPLRRYFKHVRKWNTSSTARKVLPAVLSSALYSLVVAFTLRHLPTCQYHLGSLTKGASAAMASLTGPLALLLTLRTNASLGRLVEARALWGRLVLHTRSLAGLLVAAAYDDEPDAVVLACRYLTVLGWSLKAQVRSEPVKREGEVVWAMLHGGEAEWLMAQPKRNVAITTRLRHLLAAIAAGKGRRSVEGFMLQRQTMEDVVSEIEADIGGCERLLTSPIPPTYSRHLSRIMVMYLGLLPFGLVASGIPSLGTALASAAISYMLIGIDEIGMEIENPFPLLPLQQLAGAIQTDVATQLLYHRDPPPLLLPVGER